jgi:hypothetical protein
MDFTDEEIINMFGGLKPDEIANKMEQSSIFTAIDSIEFEQEDTNRVTNRLNRGQLHLDEVVDFYSAL